ncbi:MAG: FAD-dependent oxidoreductase, partial [Desulfobacteraceae bacterium]
MIGAGLAGLIAALEAAKGSKDVLLVDRGSIGAGTNSALSNGIFAGPTRGYQKSDYVRDVLTSGKGLNQRAFVERVSENALD